MQIHTQLGDIGETLAATSFPLTDSVLRNMRGFTGAQFVVADRSGEITASSRDDWPARPLPSAREKADGEAFSFDERVTVGDEVYFRAVLALHRPFTTREGTVLYVLYPVASYQKAWWEAVLPPLGVGLAGLLTMVFLSFAIASRVTRPIHRLCQQVDRIAHGEFVPVSTSPRNDEVRDLGLAVNRMAGMLSGYEAEVRRNERLRTLGRLGGGIAHQIRNAATGCRLAVDLHRRSCTAASDETLDIACQQLDLMEDFLDRFLSLGKWQAGPLVPVNVTEVVQRVLPLVQPKARHLGVDLHWAPPADALIVSGNADALAQVVVNLILNAIEAAAERREGDAGDESGRRVVVRLGSAPDSTRVRIQVLDTGDGPAEHVRGTLFESLVSGKPDGVGLGLSIAQEVVEHHGGDIAWCRQEEMTCFTVELPAVGAE